MSGPLVSVVVPVHGPAPFLGAALDSVAAQTHGPCETILVLDGECSQLPDLEKLDVRVLRQSHAGVGAARNRGIEAATGELIALLDQDDVWRPNKLERQVETLAGQSRLDFVQTQLEVTLEPGVPRPRRFNPAWLDGPAPGNIPSTWLVRRETFEEVGGFDERYQMGCDTDWLLRAKLGAWQSLMIEEPLVRWRLHGANATYDDAAVVGEVLLVMRRSAERQRRGRTLRVGAVIAARNYERYVGEAIESLLKQTHRPSEIVVVDDGSSDATAAVADRYVPQIRVVRIEHSGIGAARNRGVAELRDVDAVVTLDADDLLTPHSIERRAQVLAIRGDVDIVFGHCERFEQMRKGQPVVGPAQPAHIASGMLVRRRALERTGPFRTGLRVAEGLDWLLRARELGLRSATVPEVVCWRRVHGENNSLKNRGALGEFPRALKASLDRRRASAGQQ
jgi:glycosyltransferase involved in cell wall biosynthesis